MTHESGDDPADGSPVAKGDEDGVIVKIHGSVGVPVVGIGASAGGLKAFTAFLKALRPDLGMTDVLVPHLDPARESAYTEIPGRISGAG